MSENSSFRRLWRLVVTVVLNLTLTIAVGGAFYGQKQTTLVHCTLISWSQKIAVDSGGWLTNTERRASPGFGIRFVSSRGAVPVWDRIDESHDIWTVFPGVYCGGTDQSFGIAVRHFVVISMVSICILIYHRRLIVRLLRR